MNFTNNSEIKKHQTNNVLFQVHCIIYIPLFTIGILIHVFGIAFHFFKPGVSGGSTVRVWAIAISAMDIVDLLYGGIYRTLTYAKYVPYVPIKPYLFLQYFIGGLSPIYTLGFTAEKMIAVTWPLHCRDWIAPRHALIGIISSSIYLAVFCIIHTTFSFDWTPKMNKTPAFDYFYWFEAVVNIILVGILHLIASLFIIRALISSSFNRKRLSMSISLRSVKRQDGVSIYHSVNAVPRDTNAQVDSKILSIKEFRICVIILLINVAYFLLVLPYFTMKLPRNMGRLNGRVLEIVYQIVRPMPWACRLFNALFLYVADSKFRSWIVQCLKRS